MLDDPAIVKQCDGNCKVPERSSGVYQKKNVPTSIFLCKYLLVECFCLME